MNNFSKYLNKLPIIPEVASKILSIGEGSDDYSFKTIEEIISIDPMLTSRILKVANSSLYARQKEITTLQMAVGLLGFKNIKSLVLLLTASQFSKKLDGSEFYENFWKHSIATAFIAREIYYRNKDRTNQDTAFTLALLHDIGRVALYNADPETYGIALDRAKDSSMTLIEAERELFGTDHQEVGAAVLQHWNLPEVFAETAGQHGNAVFTSQNRLMIHNISIADIIAEKLGYGTVIDHSSFYMQDILSGSDVSEEDMKYFLNDFQKVLDEDPLYRECAMLFLSGKG